MTTTSQLRSLIARSQSGCDSRYKAVASSGMFRPALAPALVVAALLAACGSGSTAPKADTAANATASTNDDTGGSTPAQGRAAAGRGVRLVGRRLPRPGLPHLAARRQAAALRRRAGGRDRRRPRWQAEAQPFLDIRPKVTAGGEQGLLSMAFAPGLRAARGCSTCTTPRRAAQRRSGSTAAPAPTAPTPSSARLVLRMDDPEPNHNGGLMIFGPDKLHLRRHRRWRRRQRPARPRGNAQNARLAAGQDPAHRPEAVGRQGRTRSRPRIRSPGAPAPAARSTPTGCATRGASPSTASPTT